MSRYGYDLFIRSAIRRFYMIFSQCLQFMLFQSLKGIASFNLRHSSFSGCKDITDLGLQKFCNQCPNLESLDLSNCYQLTDNSIKSLAFCCKFLMSLNISGCNMVIRVYFFICLVLFLWWFLISIKSWLICQYNTFQEYAPTYNCLKCQIVL